jgi:hypothetical protein
MMTPFRTHLAAVIALCIAATIPIAAQEAGPWRAVSNTAHTITGDVIFSDTKLTINFTSFIMSQIRDLQPAEALALFNADATGQGHLYRISIPAEKRFLHHNTLCGSEPTDWAITFVSGRNLQVAFFSGAAIPTLTIDALNDSATLCGTYTYGR